MRVCLECFSESKALCRKYEADGAPAKCDVCSKHASLTLEAEDLAPMFRGLATLYEVAEQGWHFHRDDEDGDNFEMGDTGEELPQILQDDWPIFQEHVDLDIINEFLEEAWPDYQSDSLYAREAFGDRRPDDEWDSIKHHIKHKRRFFHDSSNFDFSSLPSLLSGQLTRLKSKKYEPKWVRARVNRDKREPFPLREMGAPPSSKAKPGRANPAGIAYLYLATDERTACAEVRAEPGQTVSIADFVLKPNLKLLNLARKHWGVDPFAHADLRGKIDKSTLLSAFAKDLSKPVLAEDALIDYVPTQYLVEFFAVKGFDGIKYRSSVGSGFNLVLFDPSHATAKSVRTVKALSKSLELRPGDVVRESE